MKNLSKTLNKKAETVGADGRNVTPNMPPNDNKNEGTTPGGKLQPPSGGTTKGVNPDANAKTSTAGMAAEGMDKEKKVSMPAGDSKGEIPASKTNTDETKKEEKSSAAAIAKLAKNILSNKEGKAWLVNSLGQEMADQIVKVAAESDEKCKGCGMMKSACKCQPAGDKDKAASGDDLIIDPSFHFKLASLMLATEENRLYAQRVCEKAFGAEAAADIVKAATIMEQRAEEMSAMEAAGAKEAEAKWASATEGERNQILKLARVHHRTREGYQTDWEKQAYDAGAMAAAQMGDAGMLGGAGGAGGGGAPGAEAGGGMPPGGDPAAAMAAMAGGAGGGGAPGGMPPGAEGGMPPGADGGMPPGAEGGAGGGELSEESVVAALQQMVQSGEITPEMAAEILTAITGGGAGGEGGAGGGMPPGAGGGMPPGAEGGMPPGAAEAAAAGGGEPEKGGGEKEKAPAKEEKEEKAEPGGEDKEATLIKKAHALAVATIAATLAKPAAAAKK